MATNSDTDSQSNAPASGSRTPTGRRDCGVCGATLDAPAESQRVCYTCMGGRSDGEKWVDYYGGAWHADPDCAELGDTRWAVDETVRPPCEACVPGGELPECAHDDCARDADHDVDVTEAGETEVLSVSVCDHHQLELETLPNMEVSRHE